MILDQITKALVLKYLPLYHSKQVIPGLFNLTHIHNKGGAFSIFANTGFTWLQYFLFILAPLLAMGLIFYLFKNTSRTDQWLRGGLALIFGGAAGNLVDRFRLGEVVDFLDFYLGTHHWPVFNIADSAVTIGIGIFILHLLSNRTAKVI